MDLGIETLPKIDQNSIQKGIENKKQVGMDFGRLLERFGVDFGAKLGAKLGPSWHQNQKKSDAKTMSKKHQKKEVMKSGRVGLTVESSRGPGPPVSLWLKPKATT